MIFVSLGRSWDKSYTEANIRKQLGPNSVCEQSDRWKSGRKQCSHWRRGCHWRGVREKSQYTPYNEYHSRVRTPGKSRSISKFWILMSQTVVFASRLMLLYVEHSWYGWTVIWLQCKLTWVMHSGSDYTNSHTRKTLSQEQCKRAAICLNGGFVGQVTSGDTVSTGAPTSTSVLPCVGCLRNTDYKAWAKGCWGHHQQLYQLECIHCRTCKYICPARWRLFMCWYSRPMPSTGWWRPGKRRAAVR